jgi:hypothetical protein
VVWSGFGRPRLADLEQPKPPHGHWGWSGHPQRLTIFYFFLVWALGVVGPPPMAKPPLMDWPATLGFLKYFLIFYSFIIFNNFERINNILLLFILKEHVS